MLLELQIPTFERPPFQWRLQLSELTDAVFKATVGEAIHNFFRENTGLVDSAGSLWEAFKVTIRGVCICVQAEVLRDLGSRIQNLAAEISELERMYETDPSPATLSAIRDLVTDHNETVDQEMAHRSKRSKVRYYGEGGRPGRTLAQKLAAPRSQDYILEILDSSGNACYGTAAISKAIIEYYTTLYSNRDVVTRILYPPI